MTERDMDVKRLPGRPRRGDERSEKRSFVKKAGLPFFCSVADPWHFGMDPYLWLTDPDWDPDPTPTPDPALNPAWQLPSRWTQKIILSPSFLGSYLLKLPLHHFSKIKSHKEVSQNSQNRGFSYFFCLMIEGSESGSVPHTNGSGSATLLFWIFFPPFRHIVKNVAYKICSSAGDPWHFDADPYIWLTDSDPTPFFNDFKMPKKLFFRNFSF